MEFREYGKNNDETIMLLHGGGLSWWNYRNVAEQLRQDYHVILPVLDGHAGSDREFTSIEDNAAEIISFVDHELGGSVLLLGGLSLGAQIVLETLSQKNDICRYAIVESVSVIPSRLTNALIAPTFGSSYGLIKNRSFARLQFQSLHIRQELFEDYYRDTCGITREDMIAFMKASTSYSLKNNFRNLSAKTHVYFGEKETGEIRRSSEAICQKLPGSVMHALPGLRHGEFSINHADEYAAAVRQMICSS